MIIIYLHTGHAYRVSDSLSLAQVNNQLDTNPDRFIEVPLAPNAAVGAGTAGQGQDVKNLFLTPGSVSHFIVT